MATGIDLGEVRGHIDRSCDDGPYKWGVAVVLYGPLNLGKGTLPDFRRTALRHDRDGPHDATLEKQVSSEISPRVCLQQQ